MPGAIVYLETSDDQMEQVHLTNFSIDYDDCSVSFTFGNKYDENDIKSLFDDVFGSVKTSAAAVKYLKNIVNDQRSELDKQRDWIDNALTLTKNHFLTSNNQSVIIDDSGYWGRRQSTDADGNLIFDTKGNPIYDNEQLRIVNNTIAITKDNWQRIATAIGKIYLYHDDATGEDVYEYGVAGKLLLGDMIIGKTLSLLGSPRADGTYAITLNENGLTIINDGTSAGMTIQDAYGNKQFYADSNGNLHLSAAIVANSGNIAELTLSAGAMFKVNGWAESGAYTGYSSGLNAMYANAPGRDIFLWVGEHRGGDLEYNTPEGFDNAWTEELSAWDWKAVSPSWNTTVQDSIKNSAPFYVTWDGALHASNAYIKGNITATSGSVGGWIIDSSRIYNYNADTGYTFTLWNPGIAGGSIISCDKDGVVPFYVSREGYLHASNADITGTINATSGSFKGTINAGSVVALNIEGSGGAFKLGNLSLWNNSQGTVFYSPYSGGNNRAYLSLGYTTASLSMSRGVGVVIDANGSGTLHGTWAYANGSSGSLSDLNAKTDITTFTDNYDCLFDNLQPCLYKYKNGTSNRKHFGLIAQDTEKAILQSNLTQKDVAFVMDIDYHDEQGNKLRNKFLRYEEFIALNIWQIQKLKHRIKELEKTIEGLV